ncbi:MAG: hypothetical protein ACO1OB_06420, partial [Archangium sp.]
MKQQRRQWGLLGVVVCVAVAACDANHANPTGTGAKSTEQVGAMGGTVELEGTTLDIPAGALPEGTSITVTSSTVAAPVQFESFSPVFKFEPEGLEFDKPVKIQMRAVSPGGSKLVIFWTKKGNPNEYEELPSKQENDVVTAEVTHFSSGFIGESQSGSNDAGTGGGSPDSGIGGGSGGGTAQDAGVDAGVEDAGTDAGTGGGSGSDAGTGGGGGGGSGSDAGTGGGGGGGSGSDAGNGGGVGGGSGSDAGTGGGVGGGSGSDAGTGGGAGGGAGSDAGTGGGGGGGSGSDAGNGGGVGGGSGSDAGTGGGV